MKRYSNGYLITVAIGVMFAIQAYILHSIHPDVCAVLTVFAFLFLWAPQMLPDYEKYRD